MGKELATVPIEGQVQVWTSLPKSLVRAHGLDNMDASDIAIPRLKLAQSGTPEAKKMNEKYIDGLVEGDFYNSISQRIYGPSVRIIPVAFTKNRVLYQDTQIDCRSSNAKDGGNHSPTCRSCEYAVWGTGNEGKGEACTLFLNYVCYIIEDKSYALFSFKRGTIKVAEQFNATIKAQTRIYKDAEEKEHPFSLEIYGCEYMLTATMRSEGAISWAALGYKYVRDVIDGTLLDEFAKQQEVFLVSKQYGVED